MEQARDINGYAVFCTGDCGAAHVTAHRMLDSESYELGHRFLAAWLEHNQGTGSEWVHLQWHMLVFELALENWEDARARFDEHILPAARYTRDALCDAPAGLWRLSLAAPRPVELPWVAVRATAVSQMTRADNDPYVDLHNLLALAGARDAVGIDLWLDDRSPASPTLRRMALALRAYAAGHYRYAATALAATLPDIDELGGSRAQNELFHDILHDAWRRAEPSLTGMARN